MLILVWPPEVHVLLEIHEFAAGDFEMRPVQRTRRLPAPQC